MQRRTFLLEDSLDMFLLDCEAKRLTQSTLSFYKSKLTVFITWCSEQNIQYLEQISANEIRKFLVSIQRRQLSGQYQHNLARAIRAFLNYCVRDELIDKSPFDKVQMPRVEKKILAAFSGDDIQVVLRHCRIQRDKAICFFLLDSGVRSGELVALNIKDVRLDSGEVAVRSGKGQKQRICYIGARTRKELKRYLIKRNPESTDEPLFVSVRRKERLTVSGMVQLMKRLRRRSGVEICTCHTFRRTFAITCLRNGMNIYALARLMGHADIAILRQYLALVQEDLREAHRQFGAVDSLVG